MSRNKIHQAIDIIIGKKIRQARLEKGMSQQDLAKHLIVTFQQIQKYEKGTDRFSASKLSVAAKILDKPIYYFFDEMPIICAPETRGQERIFLNLSRVWQSLSDIQRDALLRVMEVMGPCQ